MKKLVLLLPVLSASSVYACTTCNRSLQSAIFNSTFYPNLFTMLLAFVALGLIVILLTFLTSRSEKKLFAGSAQQLTVVPLVSASTILGIGLGGFIDGIVFHQILQWHEMLSNKIPPNTLLYKSVNMFWDGIFHAFCLLVVIIGLYMLFKLFFRNDVVKRWRVFNGGLLFGWGVFNFVEGIIDHQVLKLHNVREITADVAAWNYGFLVASIVLMVVGFLLLKSKQGNYA